MKKIMISLMAAVVLLCAACKSSDVITTLQLAVDAASIALPLVSQSAGISPELESQLETYLGTTNTAISQASTILAGPGTPAQKSSAIVAAFSTDSVPVMPAGTPLAVVQAVQAVSADVARFLQITATPATASLNSAPKAVKLDPKIVEALVKIKSKADANASWIKSRAKHVAR